MEKRRGAKEGKWVALSVVCPTMQTGFLISLYCFHCSSGSRGGIVSHYTGTEKSEKVRKEREQGLSACPNADHPRHSLPAVGLFRATLAGITSNFHRRRTRDSCEIPPASHLRGRVSARTTTESHWTRIPSITYFDLIRICAMVRLRKIEKQPVTKRMHLLIYKLFCWNACIMYR